MFQVQPYIEHMEGNIIFSEVPKLRNVDFDQFDLFEICGAFRQIFRDVCHISEIYDDSTLKDRGTKTLQYFTIKLLIA